MTENPLGYEKISKLLKDFAIPSIMASLVGSIYNIVDQIFIGQGVGYLGNAATNVAYPFSTICLAIALLVGIGSASRVSLCLGRKEPKAAAKAAGNGIVLMGIFGIIYLLVGEAFLSLLLKAFGATTDVFPYAKQYASITLIGMPFLIVTNGMSNLIRADGKPKYSMVCMVMGAIINTILDPIFIFACDWGIAGAAWATVIGQIFSFILALRYLWRFQTIHFEKESFLLDIKESMKICSMGISSSSTGTTMVIIGCATAFTKILTIEKIPGAITNGIINFTDNKILILLLINVLLLIVGCFMDTTPAMMVLAPILLPIAMQFGVDPIHFGIVMVVNLAIGFITPPLGINLFVASRVGRSDLETVCSGIIKFILVMVVDLLLITFIPAISMTLPNIFMK